MKRQKTEEIEIPITPMLDMAFQLLTFFILTYHPAPSEGQYSMNLLPAQPALAMDKPATDAAASSDLPAGLKTLPTSLHADDAGMLGRVTLEDREINGMDALKKELGLILGDPTLPFDQTVLKVDPRLKYSEVIKVVEVFSDLKVTKIAFDTLGPEGTGP